MTEECVACECRYSNTLRAVLHEQIYHETMYPKLVSEHFPAQSCVRRDYSCQPMCVCVCGGGWGGNMEENRGRETLNSADIHLYGCEQTRSDVLLNTTGNTLMFQNESCCIVALLFYVHGKHLRSCRDGQLT